MAPPNVTNEAEAADLLSRLVGIPSVAPGVEGGTGEGAMSDAVAEFARGTGADVERQEALPRRYNVLCTLPAERGAPGLLLEAHMDTVALGPMRNGHRPWLDAQGRLHGRGACDTKGSLAAMLLTLQWAARQRTRPCRLVVAATVDEEVSGGGADALGKSGLAVHSAVVGEPTSLEIVRAHRGVANWRLTTLGTAAHTSMPEIGDNAIYRMAKVITVLREEFARRLQERTHPLTGPSTFSVGQIQAGTSPNVVPDRCVLQFDRRGIPGETVDALQAEIEEVLDAARRRDPGLRLELEGPLVCLEPVDTPEQAPIVRALGAACRSVTGRLAITGAPYASDAAALSKAGIPSVLCGPGDIVYGHSADEWVPVSEVVQAARIYAETWLRFPEVAAQAA